MDKNHSSDQVRPSNNAHTLGVFSRFPPLTFIFIFFSPYSIPPFCRLVLIRGQSANRRRCFLEAGYWRRKPPLSGSHLLQSLANNDSITLAAGFNIGAGLLSG